MTVENAFGGAPKEVIIRCLLQDRWIFTAIRPLSWAESGIKISSN